MASLSIIVKPAAITIILPAMPITREKELWGMALWVEKHHGENGWLFITQQQD